MAAHESQSLIVEMQACRSDAYLSWLGPELLATFYTSMGIDPAGTFNIGSGRPMYILDDRNVVGELLG